jgi:GT2 family glycosyltransferase
MWGTIISKTMNWRSRLSGLVTGDQALFVRRSIFEQMGGFADMPLMEDIEFSRRLKRKGSTAALTATVTTSFRRWEQQGPLRTILLMWTLRFLYWSGVSPHRLAHLYTMVREETRG